MKISAGHFVAVASFEEPMTPKCFVIAKVLRVREDQTGHARALSVQWYFARGNPDPYLGTYEPLIPRVLVQHEIAADCVLLHFNDLNESGTLPGDVARNIRQILSSMSSSSITVYSK